MAKKERKIQAVKSRRNRRPWWLPGLLIALALVAGIAFVVFKSLGRGRILDDHEHIQSINEVPTLLAAMDNLGVKRVALMGSSWFTITLDPSVGFTRYDENNEELMKICEKYPGRFEAWPTISPTDPEKLEKFKALVARGAIGLKLYLGHGYVNKKTNEYMFHPVAMDDPGMFPLYRYCEENFIPVCLHVNPSDKTPGFAQEFVKVLMAFPDMKLVCPHFMLSSIYDKRLREFLDTFPNLYTDISFGHDDFLIPGLKRISKNPAKFIDIFETYPTRFFFSSDLVLTDTPVKDIPWTQDRLKAYLDMLGKRTYTTSFIPGENLKGCALPPSLLERILFKNYEDFLASKPKGTKITREINWGRMNVTPIERKDGQAFPPPAPKEKSVLTPEN